MSERQATVTILVREKSKEIIDLLIDESGLKNVDFQTGALLGLRFVETDVADYVVARGILAFRLIEMGIPPTMENIIEAERKIIGQTTNEQETEENTE